MSELDARSDEVARWSARRRIGAVTAKDVVGLVATAVLILLVLASALAPVWVPLSPTQIESADRLMGPSTQHWFGTDNFGRDIFSRVVYSGRVSLSIGAATAIVTTAVGVVVGLFTGYYRPLDNVLMRIVDGLMAFPTILLAIALVAALGASAFNVVIALTLAFSPVMIRVVRASTLQIREAQFVEAAISTGVSSAHILFRHILPNALTPIIVQATIIFSEAVLAESALSFLGLGIEPPTPTWGNMLGDSRTYLTSAPWFSIFPGLAIVVTVLSLNLFGDMVRDKFNPQSPS